MSQVGSSAVTTFMISPRSGASLAWISTAWDGAGGIGGLSERMFAPRVLHAIYTNELKFLKPTRANTIPHEAAGRGIGLFNGQLSVTLRHQHTANNRVGTGKARAIVERALVPLICWARPASQQVRRVRS